MDNEMIALAVGVVAGILIVGLVIAIVTKRKKNAEKMRVTKVDKLSTKELKDIVTRKMKE